MQTKKILLSGLFSLLLFSCSNEEASVATNSAATSKTTAKMQAQNLALTATDWTSGSLSTAIVPVNNLKHLEGDLSGTPIWKSNNPEVIKGNGWLMQNARTDSTRGGSSNPLSGTFGIYLFHINKSNATKYLHVLISNPQSTAVTVSGKGSIYTNNEKPLNGIGTGQSYFVSKDRLLNTPRTTFNNVSINSFKVYEVYKTQLLDGNMVDGSYEVTASQGVYVYTVVTSSGSLTDAVNATQTPASGDIYTESTNAYGREAGIYSASGWMGSTPITLPTGPAYMGLCLNTSSKFATNGIYLQNQNAPYLYKLNGASQNTYGNYGHKYSITLQLTNPNSSAKTVSLSFASNFTSTTNSPSFTYNGPIYLNGTLKNIYTTPTQPKQTLSTWNIPANSNFNATISFYVPGLITTGQQLILEQSN
ncbi:DUF3370 family protein [Flavobacterium sp. 245]|uniref:DUF3370 family protein n=1 Tax=Flavobacterium sp. 245 TaxID=2512115 RepID=UPI0010603456|nr:DUF3370 family protein [Flavobacterium sp. 245]TDO97000.1 uncharacterized protein DUF3370 [Flavobacterium sp. 245]